MCSERTVRPLLLGWWSRGGSVRFDAVRIFDDYDVDDVAVYMNKMMNSSESIYHK